MGEQVEAVAAALAGLVPGGVPCVIRTPLAEDECAWFLRAVSSGLVVFEQCPSGCPRRVKHGVAGPDHFTSPSGAARHLFSSPAAPAPSLNREYVPHIAAWARVVTGFGHDPARVRFSYYRAYSRDLLTKRKGGSYETDIEVDDEQGRLLLQVEAKKDAPQVARLAAQLDRVADLARLPQGLAKEIEYVLDLAPRYLWLVGPGTVDPAPHVYAVEVDGLDARFRQVDVAEVVAPGSGTL